MRTRSFLVALGLLLVLPVPAAAAPPRRLRVENPAALSQARRAAAAGQAAGPAAPASSPQRATVVSGGLNQPGLSEGDNAPLDEGTPPDATGAIGPNFYVEIVNSRVGIYSRSSLGLAVPHTALGDFVGASGDIVFDPQIQWDQEGGRWLYAAIDETGPTTFRVAYGFSKTADPTGGWCQYFRASDTASSDDYPKLGHDDSHILIGSNVFDTSGSVFLSARIYSIPKPPPGNIGGSCPSATATAFPSSLASGMTNDSGNTTFTPVPVNLGDGSGTGWVLAADQSDSDGTGSTIQVFKVTGSPSSPSLSSGGEIGVAPFAPPPLVPQPGTSNTLDPLDGRLTQAVGHADPDAAGAEAIWTQHTIATSDGRSAARWYELLPASPALRQQGDINDPGLFAFNAAIAPTSTGNEAVVQYNTAGSSQLPDIRAQSRRSATPLGVMAGEVTLGNSTQVDNDDFCGSNPPCRWGDYAGASSDPSDGTLVWGSNQLTGPPHQSDPMDSFQWLTRNFALVPTGRAPAPAIASPASTGKGDQTRLDASGSVADGPIADYAWDLDGDGSFETDAGTSPVATHAFTRAGPANVSLRVTDDRGQSAVTTRQLTVVDHPPVASFTATKATILKAVRFDGSRSTDTDGRIVDYLWDLDGNGTFETDSGTNPRVSHTYRKPKKMTLHLRVRDDDGVTSDKAAVLVSHAGLSLSLKRRQRLGGRVRLKATCSAACTATFALQLSKRDARRLHLSRKIGSTKRKLRAKKRRSISISLSKKALRRVASLSTLKPTLVVTVRDASHVPFNVTRKLTLKR